LYCRPTMVSRPGDALLGVKIWFNLIRPSFLLLSASAVALGL
jgi:hypothetical protein